MKSMKEMQTELFWRHHNAPKDDNGYPKLRVCPFTGVVAIMNNKAEDRQFSMAPVYALVSCAVIFPIIFFLVR